MLSYVRRFNKREEDFEIRAEWDNYLEEREDIAFNLIENINIAAATQRLARYERENAESIVKVAARQVRTVCMAHVRIIMQGETTMECGGADACRLRHATGRSSSPGGGGRRAKKC